HSPAVAAIRIMPGHTLTRWNRLKGLGRGLVRPGPIGRVQTITDDRAKQASQNSASSDACPTTTRRRSQEATCCSTAQPTDCCLGAGAFAPHEQETCEHHRCQCPLTRMLAHRHIALPSCPVRIM